MTFSDFIARVEVIHRNGRTCECRCPAHEDGRASLSVGEGDDGRVLLCCHAGCSVDAILARLGLATRDLFPDSAPRAPARIVATYGYHDEAGVLLDQVVRFDPKDFRQRRPNGAGGWTWSLGDVRRVLYRLPRVLDAAKAGGVVYVAEGEKDVHALETLGVVATTNAQGAGKWRPEYTTALRGCKGVIVLPDNDEAGRRHADDVARSLHAASVPVKVVALPGLPPKGDVSDWTAGGGTKAQLVELAKAAPLWTPEAPAAREAERRAETRDKPDHGEGRDTLEASGLFALKKGAAPGDIENAVRRFVAALSSADPLTRECAREGVLAHLRDVVGLKAPARLLEAALEHAGTDEKVTGQGRQLDLCDPDPWPEAVDGAALLDDLAAMFSRFLVLPEGGPEVLALWVAHTFAFDRFDHTGYLAVTSPVKRCGKSTLMRLLKALSRRALAADNVSPAALWRVVEDKRPTLLIDEVDRLPKDSDLWGVLNSGHSVEGAVLRTVGDDHEPRAFSTF